MSVAPLVEQLSREMGISTASALLQGPAPRPVHPVLSPLFKRGGLPRGEVVSMTGPMSLGCALAASAEATKNRNWSAGLGLGEPAVSAIADLGVALDHFVNLVTPVQDWLRVASILIEAFDVLVIDPGYRATASERARLLAKVRERKVSVISLRPFPGSTEQIEVTDTHWQGVRQGRGRLLSCRIDIRSQTGRHHVLLPGPTGGPEYAELRPSELGPTEPTPFELKSTDIGPAGPVSRPRLSVVPDAV